MRQNQIEILAPAGSYESLKAAVCAGADAVYIGGSKFGARAFAENFSEEEMLSAIDYVHLHGRKIYMTVNTLLKDGEIEELYEYLLPYYKQGLDAVIVQDVGVLEYVREHFPGLSLHVSTQMTVTGAYGAAFFKEQGAERIVPAREISLEEVQKIKAETGLEIECFVHGALCYCYSGQCLMSSMIGGRSGNRGQCAQPCRLPYSVAGSKPQDILSLKDLCTIERFPELIEAGIDSFKIEGRMKQPDYVYTVVSVYRKYTDLYQKNGKVEFSVTEEDKKLLLGAYRRRGYTEGYYKQHNGKNMISLKRPSKLADEAVAVGDMKIKEKINGELILSEGAHAKIYLQCDGNQIEYEGTKVQKALKQPLDTVRIEKQMRKTGETQFEFENLKIIVKGDIFLPMQDLNELRRESIQKLKEAILAKYRRKKNLEQADQLLQSEETDHLIYQSRDTENEVKFTVTVSDFAQLKEVLGDSRISKVYVDGFIGFDKKVVRLLESSRGVQKICFAMPYIFRENTIMEFSQHFSLLRNLYDGVLIRNWESYGWLLERCYDKEIISDYQLYIFNQESKCFIRKTRIDGYTASVELNFRELKNLDISDGTIIVYGYQPVMVTANCIWKSTDKCTHKEETLYLADRYHKKFAVKKYCKYCYNIIYNSAPLVLLSQVQEIKKLAPAGLRLDFTTEQAKEMKRVLNLYEKAFLLGQEVEAPDMEYTKGHFRRGVK